MDQNATPVTHPSADPEVVIVGGGPAGLQAALTLGRVHRRALLIDSGEYRNARAEQMHNIITHDERPPAEFRERARRDIARYDTVDVLGASVESITGTDDGFQVRTSAGTSVHPRVVLLATGVRDVLPDVPGLAPLFGTVVAHCPFCHGHEFAGGAVGVLGSGAPAAHVGTLMSAVASDVVVFTDGATLDEGGAAALADLAVRPERVTRVTRIAAGTRSDGVRLMLTGGEPVDLAGLFVAPTYHQSAPFAEQLGLELTDSGCVAIDEFGRTSRAGVFAAGDLAHLRSLPGPLSSVVSAMAAGQVAAAAMTRELMS